MQSILPLWQEIRTDAKLDDLQFQMPFGTATMKSLGESVDLSGFTPSGFAEFDLKLEDLEVSSTLLPGWVSSLSPASFDLSVRLTGEDWDKLARIALDDPHFGELGDLSPETSDQITQVLLAGHPKVVFDSRSPENPCARPRLRGRSLGDIGRADRPFQCFRRQLG